MHFASYHIEHVPVLIRANTPSRRSPRHTCVLPVSASSWQQARSLRCLCRARIAQAARHNVSHIMFNLQSAHRTTDPSCHQRPACILFIYVCPRQQAIVASCYNLPSRPRSWTQTCRRRTDTRGQTCNRFGNGSMVMAAYTGLSLNPGVRSAIPRTLPPRLSTHQSVCECVLHVPPSCSRKLIKMKPTPRSRFM
jgi:hypothetical protein